MTDTATLNSILSRLKAVNGPDRKIDDAIHIAFNPELAVLPRASDGGWIDPRWGRIAEAQCYTASVDACIALADRVLHGWIWNLDNGSPALFELPYAYVAIDAPRDIASRFPGATPAIAFLTAIISALIAKKTAATPPPAPVIEGAKR